MKKVWKIVLPLCAAAILIGAGVFLYFNAQAKVENPYFPLDDSAIVTGNYSNVVASANGLSEQFCLTKKQKMKVNQWIAEQKFEEKENIYDENLKASYYGVSLGFLDNFFSVYQRSCTEDNYSDIRYIARQFFTIKDGKFITSEHRDYEITREQYNEFMQLCKGFDLANEKKTD